MTNPDDVLSRLGGRLDRAHEHIKTFETKDAEFFQLDPYGFVAEHDPNDASQIVRLRVFRQVPLDMRLVVGDCIHNLRATLDNLAWELALLTTTHPRRQTEFPVCDTLDGWNKRKWVLRDVPPAAQDLIQGLQPYHTPAGPNIRSKQGGDWMYGGPHSHWLWVLDRLWNNDKHRATTLLGTATTGIELDSRGDTIPDEVRRAFAGYHVQFFPFRYEDGSIVLRVQSPDGKTQPHVDANLTMEIAFGHGPAFGRGTLEGLIEFEKIVRDDVLPRFAPFFG